MHFCFSGFDVVCGTKKDTLKSNTSGQSFSTETHQNKVLASVVLIQYAKKHLKGVFFLFPDFLKSTWIYSGYTLDIIWIYSPPQKVGWQFEHSPGVIEWDHWPKCHARKVQLSKVTHAVTRVAMFTKQLPRVPTLQKKPRVVVKRAFWIHKVNHDQSSKLA